MRGRLIVGLVLGAAITGALIAAPASATPQTTIKAVVIGDSYSAGTGGGSYTDTDCYRSDNSWAQHYVDWLNTQPGVSATLQNLACKGATTDEIADQVDQIPADTNLVMLTAGRQRRQLLNTRRELLRPGTQIWGRLQSVHG